MARPTDDPKTYRLDLRFPPELVQEVDEWRRCEEDIPPRAEAIRRLIERGMKADSKIDQLAEDIAILRAVAREWAEKAGADQKVLDAISSNDPGAASSNSWLRKVNPQVMGLEATTVRNVKPPRQRFPKPPKKE